MGKLFSKSVPDLLSDPWRPTLGWDNDVRGEMKTKVADLGPESTGPDGIPFLNILLTGQVGAGKSSFCNSVHDIYHERIVNRAEVGNRAQSLTKEFRIYKIQDSTAWRICDTMGLQSNKGIGADHILYAVDGKIPDKYEFAESDLHPESPGLIPHPTLADKAHCVAIVVDAAVCNQMRVAVWRKLELVRKELLSREIPTFILLSKVDKICPHVKRNVANVYLSVAVRDACEKVSRKLELPLNHIFPIKNYCDEVDLDDAKDILLLYALRQMLQTAQEYVTSKLATGAHIQTELLDIPVREVGWDRDTREQLKTTVANKGPPNPTGVEYINILLAGQIGSGKSSFCNSLISLFRGDIVDKAEVGNAPQSLTKNFRIYPMRESPRSASFSWRICDTMGLMPVDGGIDADHILQAVDGQLPDNYEFTDSSGKLKSQDLNSHPTLADQAHCVAFVVDAANCNRMHDEIWKKLKKLREGLISRRIPICIVLTKIDLLCPHVVRDIKNVYRSPIVDDVMRKVSNKLMGLPRKQIFPIKNYEAEVNLDDVKDILLLYAVRKMLVDAEVYLETKEEESNTSRREPVEN